MSLPTDGAHCCGTGCHAWHPTPCHCAIECIIIQCKYAGQGRYVGCGYGGCGRGCNQPQGHGRGHPADTGGFPHGGGFPPTMALSGHHTGGFPPGPPGGLLGGPTGRQPPPPHTVHPTEVTASQEGFPHNLPVFYLHTHMCSNNHILKLSNVIPIGTYVIHAALMLQTTTQACRAHTTYTKLLTTSNSNK